MPTNHSYFISITLPDPLYSEIELVKKKISEKYGTKSVLRSPAHITIVPPFFWGNETELLEALSGFSYPEFKIELKNYQRFLERVIYIDVVENKNLLGLHQQFNAYFFERYPGIHKRHPYPFQPHVTVGNRDWKPEQFNKCWEEYKDEKFSASFKFEKLALLKNVSSKWLIL